MNRSIAFLAALGLAFALGCGSDEAQQAAEQATAAAQEMAEDAAAAAQEAADATQEAAQAAADSATEAAGDMMADGVAATCRTLAEQGAWGDALDVCRKAHEANPDDMALEHAYQQAQAAAK